MEGVPSHSVDRGGATCSAHPVAVEDQSASGIGVSLGGTPVTHPDDEVPRRHRLPVYPADPAENDGTTTLGPVDRGRAAGLPTRPPDR